MKKIIVLLITAVTILTGCKNKPSMKDLPLDRAQIKKVLRAVHLKEGEFKLEVYRFDSSRIEVQQIYDSIFQANNVEDSSFYQTYYAYYEHYPDELDSIYGELIKEFQLVKDSLDIQFRDSILKDRMKLDEQPKELELKFEDHRIEYDD